MLTPLLNVKELTIFVKQADQLIPAVKDLHFQIHQGECLGIVGESGCGKSLTAQTVACQESYAYTGSIQFQGEAYAHKNAEQKRKMRAEQIGIIFQNPQACLNPTMKIGHQIQEVSASLTKEDVFNLLKQVGLKEFHYRSYPHELSGGMCQRVMIAITIARQPQLIVADEPTTALDVTTQSQILDLLKSIQQLSKTSILLITHDFNVVEKMCDRLMVMYAGEIIEKGSVKEVLQSPLHPYTKALLASRPILGKGKNYPLKSIPGRPPSMLNIMKGCPFHPRCEQSLEICSQQRPSLTDRVACWQFSKDSYAT